MLTLGNKQYYNKQFFEKYNWNDFFVIITKMYF